MIIGRKSCSRPLSGKERSCPLRLGKANARAVASRELGSASLQRNIGVASLPEMVKPASIWKSRPGTQIELPGVRGDSARRKTGSGPWEAGGFQSAFLVETSRLM